VLDEEAAEWLVAEGPSVLGYDFAQEEQGRGLSDGRTRSSERHARARTILPRVVCQIENLTKPRPDPVPGKIIALPAKWKTESARPSGGAPRLRKRSPCETRISREVTQKRGRVARGQGHVEGEEHGRDWPGSSRPSTTSSTSPNSPTSLTISSWRDLGIDSRASTCCTRRAARTVAGGQGGEITAGPDLLDDLTPGGFLMAMAAWAAIRGLGDVPRP